MNTSSNELRSGWATLAMGWYGNLSSVFSLLYFGLSSFLKPLQSEFGWSRSNIGLALMFMTFMVVVISPLVGKACDHYGSRVVVLTSIPLSAISIASLSRINAELWQLYAGYSLTVLLGAGTMGVAYVRTITSRFDRRQGLALGIAFSGAGVTALLLPLILTPVIQSWGWRRAFCVLAILPLLQWPLAFAVIPRSMQGQVKRRNDRGVLEPGLGFSDVVSGWRFWILSTAFFLLGLALAGLVVNLFALLTDHGMTVQSAARVTSALGLGVVTARVLAGWIVDHLPARHVAAGGFLGAALGCGCLYTNQPLVAGLGTLFIGLAIGSEMDLLAYMTTRYFGLKEQALIFGAVFSVFTAGGFFSPLLIGSLYSATGNYDAALCAGSASCVLAALLVNRMGSYPSNFDKPRKANTVRTVGNPSL